MTQSGHAGPRRILFFAEAVTLAHVARPVVLAQGLDAARFSAELAWDGRFARLFPGLGLPTHAITSLSCERFAAALAGGRPVFPRALLEQYVQADRQLIRALRPDAVVGDFRLSLAVSARLEGVPYAAISNAYWSPRARLRIPVPDVAFARWLGPTLAQWVFDRVRPYAFARHAAPLEALRRAHGLADYGGSLQRAYTDGDITLYADLPGLVDLARGPEDERLLGPVPWSPDVPLPNGWQSLPTDRPLAYLTLGSSGDPRTLPVLLEALSGLGITVALAGAGRAGHLPPLPHVYSAEFVPGAALCARADVVVCNGGAPTSQQALLAGRPVLGVCTNLDQLLNMAGIEAAGAGLSMRAGAVTAASVRQAVRRLLHEPGFRQAAGRLAAGAAGLDPVATLTGALDSLLGRPGC